MDTEKLKALAKDLRREPPRSPRDLVGGLVIVGRCLDKCRADLLGINGDYEFWPCSLCSELIAFTGMDREAFRAFVATGADDEAVGEWVRRHARVQDRAEIIRWNNRMRQLRPSDLSDDMQAYLEEYIPQHLPKGRPVYVWFDVFDIEEGRLA